MECLLVSLVGPRGCGKTTQVGKLTSFFNDYGIKAYDIGLFRKTVSKKKLLQNVMNYLKENNIANCSNQEMEMVIQSMGWKISFDELVMPHSQEKCIILLDRYIERFEEMYSSFEPAYRIIKSFPPCDLNIVLEISYEKSLDRIIKRNGCFSDEDYKNQKDREDFQNRILKSKIEYKFIDAERDEQVVFEDLRSLIEKKWNEKMAG